MDAVRGNDDESFIDRDQNLAVEEAFMTQLNA
jgi:hypothetical protein